MNRDTSAARAPAPEASGPNAEAPEEPRLTEPRLTWGRRLEMPFVWCALGIIHGYRRLLGPLLPPACRFYPSCSQYGLDALRYKRLLPALGCIAWRICRCHPLTQGGYDPVR